MLVLPIESRTLLVVGPPVPQYQDRERTQPRIDRDTGEQTVEVPVCLTSDEGRPQMLRVQLPASGVPQGLAAGQMVKVTGLTVRFGEKDGRPWQMFRATAMTAVKSA
ncbi:MAG TPA: hypothetical protein VH561_09780 [Micromonosporaceae bacterium]|jgi:hypothetical protein